MDATTLYEWALSTEDAVAVLGSAGQFELIPLTPEPLPDSFTADMRARGFYLCGLLGMRAGTPAVAIEPTRADAIYTVLMASFDYAQRVAEKVKREQTGDGCGFLERLYQLPDPRD
jgi:hypothetical protein